MRNNSFHPQIRLRFNDKLVRSYVRCIALYDAKIWTFRKVDEEYLAGF